MNGILIDIKLFRQKYLRSGKTNEQLCFAKYDLPVSPKEILA